MGSRFIDSMAPSPEVARRLMGATLLVDGAGGIIVETEPYDREDPVSHTYPGPTQRDAALLDPPALAYVYRSHDIHWCLNIVCREEGHGEGVLIRAIEPIAGLAVMRQRRGQDDVRLLCAGPVGCRSGVGHRARTQRPVDCRPRVVSGPRIGISKAMEQPWCLGLEGSRFFQLAVSLETLRFRPRPWWPTSPKHAAS